MNWKNVKLIFLREVKDQLRDRRTLFMITVLPVLLYPMLGLGLVEMLLTFSEQQRTVVILNAHELPEDPALLQEGAFAAAWHDGDSSESDRMQVVTDLTTDTAPSGEASDPEDSERKEQADEQRELLAAGTEIAGLLDRMYALSRGESTDGEASGADMNSLQDAMTDRFNDSGFHVLIIVPEGYRRSFAALSQSDGNTGDGQETAEAVPPLLVVRNSADDKSAMACRSVRGILNKWEAGIRQALFNDQGLPAELQQPARLAWIEVARDEQVSANVWSKLFPALLVIMALTGAFYPAIDLGAGEKERGTMETLLISPARRVELVLGKFATIVLFSIGTALLNLLSMGLTGTQMAGSLGAGVSGAINLELPGWDRLIWVVVLLIPLASLFGGLCLGLATFARSSKEGQHYLTPLLMVVMGMTMFCLSPAVEMTPFYSILPVVNVALLLKGLLLAGTQAESLYVYAVPVVVSSVGYSLLALWWAIELYSSEDVLFRETERFDLRLWMKHLLREKDAVPAVPEAGFCFLIIMILQFMAMSWLQPPAGVIPTSSQMMRTLVIQQITMIACPALFMGLLLTTSMRATFRLRMPSMRHMGFAAALAVVLHPLSLEFNSFMMEHNAFPPLPEGVAEIQGLMQGLDQPVWLVLMVFAVTPAICEELAFRGFILSGFARGGRLAIAIGISSIMFGAMHLIPQQSFNAALLGLGLGLLAVNSRSLAPGILFHFLFNSFAVLHTRWSASIPTDEVFLTRSASGVIRYEAPLLLACGIVAAGIIVEMIRSVVRERDLQRRGILPGFRAEGSRLSNAAAATR